jgi:DNA-binding CsgD family transcriptional regulator
VNVLSGLVAAVRAGQSQVLVLRGEPGVGKTALLDYLAGQAQGCRVVRAAGMQSEMEFAFAGLHQLLAPMLNRLEQLPVPQREALRTVFGLSTGPPPDRFLVALAVLSLLSEAAGERPLVCVVDDQQWLDQASAQALGFAARRLAADPVGLVFAARVPGEELAGLPELTVAGLTDGDARALLDSALTGPLDDRVRDQVVAEARGNPLALLELPRGMTPAELAGGFGLPGAQPGHGPLAGRIEDSFRRRLEALPEQTRRLLLVAAADPAGDPALVWRAAGRLGLPVQAAVPAAKAGLAEFGARVRFRHPLVRSAAYWSASFTERQQVHAVLAEVTDPAADPDRRAWHRAQAAAGPDEGVAAELERGAGRAQARGGLAAAAAFLERAVRLTADPARMVERTLAAAQANVQAGAFDKALGLLVMTEAWPLDEFTSAQRDLLRGQIAFASGLSNDAPPLLLKAARRLELLNLELARATYLGAWGAAFIAGRHTADDLAEISRAARALPRSPRPGPVELLLDGLALLITDGLPAAAPALRQAVSVFAGADIAVDDGLRWGWLATEAAYLLFDDDGWHAILARQVRLARSAGVLEHLPIYLVSVGVIAAFAGDFAAAASLIAETEAVCDATGSRRQPYPALLLTCLRGSQAEAVPLIEATLGEAEGEGQGIAVTYARWTAAILYNGLGRYDEARGAALQAAEDPSGFYISIEALPELIEAAVRSGNMHMADDALARLADTAQVSGTGLALGLEARSRALMAEDHAADSLYREAIDRLGRTRHRPGLARAHLLYGEWLRRQGHRTQAREQLRTAHGMLDEIGMEAFAERARRELQATGETARKRTAPAAEVGPGLTAQELQVARLARDGLSNPEIGARLFISSRTAQYHLGKVFTKLGITSRSQLHRVLSGDPAASGPGPRPTP